MYCDGAKEMTPTTRFRYIERQDFTEDLANPRTIRILQQWWEDKNIVLAVHITDKDGNTLPSPNRGEWRDIPLEQEA
jgi:hypothetical protein